jgi:hypothetical protein
MKRCIAAEIEIDAPAAVVWKVLADFPGYCSWNPTIRRIQGRLAAQACLRVFACLPCGLPMLLRPRVLECRPERELRWVGNLLIPGLFEGEHLFLLEPLSACKTRFVQREEFNGILLPLLWKWFGDQGRRAFEAMNLALKTEAERYSERSP